MFTLGVNECNGAWVLKKCVIENVFSVAMIAVAEFFLFTSAKSLHSGYGRLAEEADQSLEVLGSRCQEELLTHKP